MQALTAALLSAMAMAMLARPGIAGGPANCADAGVRCLAGRGVIEDSDLGLTEVVWVGPESRQVFVGSPAVWKTANGSCIAAHDFFGKTTIADTVQVFADHTGHCAGHSSGWEYVGNVTGMYWANLFVPPGGDAIYLVGVSAGDHAAARSIVISKSIDAGRHWTQPSVLFPADSATGLTYHCAPTPVLVSSDNRLYRAFEMEGNAVAVLMRTKAAVGPGTDLLASASWELSGSLKFNQTTMVPPSWSSTGAHFGWQEGNAVEGPDGEIYDILRIDGQDNRTHNKAAVVRLDTSTTVGGGVFGNLVFDSMIDFPSTESKFTIRRERVGGGRYYALTTDVTPVAVALNTVYARNHLVLTVSDNLRNWTTCDTLLKDDTGFTPLDSARYTGFHYVDWVFDGDDIVFAVRAGYRGSNTYHNANRLAVKRLTDYAKTCAPWQDKYRAVGVGWCRPTDGFVPAGSGMSDRECAQACTVSPSCAGFANGGIPSQALQSCALYPSTPASSAKTGAFTCYAKR